MTVEPTTVENGQGANPGNGARQSNRRGAADETGSLLPFACIMGNAQEAISQDKGNAVTDSPGEEVVHGSSGREEVGAVETEAVPGTGTEKSGEKTNLSLPGKNASHPAPSPSLNQCSVAPDTSEGEAPAAGGSTFTSAGFRSQGDSGKINTANITTDQEQQETGTLKTALQTGASQSESAVNPVGDGETEGRSSALFSGDNSGDKAITGVSEEPAVRTGGSVSGTTAVPSPGEAVPREGSQQKGISPGTVHQEKETATVLKNGMPSSGAWGGRDGIVSMSTQTGAGTGESISDTPSVGTRGGNVPLSNMQGVDVSPAEVDPVQGNTAIAKTDIQGGGTQLELSDEVFQKSTLGEQAGGEGKFAPAGGTGGDEKDASLSRLTTGQLSESSKGDTKNTVPGKSGADLSQGTTGGTAKETPVAEDAVTPLKTLAGKTSEAVKGKIAHGVAEAGTNDHMTGGRPDPSGSPLQDVSTAKQKSIAGKNSAEKTSPTAGKEVGNGDTGNRVAGSAEGTSGGHEQTGDRRSEERTVDGVQRGTSRSTSPSQENTPSGGYQQVASQVGEKPVVAAEHVEITPRGLIDQIADSAKTSGRVRIALNPPSLGTLDMDVLVRDNKVHVTLQAENTDVKQVLQSNMDNLRTALRNQGLTVDSIQVLTQEKSDGEGFGSGRNDLWSGEGNNSGGGNRRGWNGGDVDPAASVSPLQERGTQQVAHNGGLSVFA